MTKEYLQKLFDYKFITVVTDIDTLFEKVKDMDLSKALTYLKERELFTQVIDNDKVIALLDIENIETPTVDPDDEPTVDPDDEPTVDPDDEPTVDPDDEPTVDPEGEEDESPVVDEGEEDE